MGTIKRHLKGLTSDGLVGFGTGSEDLGETF